MLKVVLVTADETNVFAQVIVVSDLLWFSPTQFVVALPAIEIIGCVETGFNTLYGVLKLRTQLMTILDVVEVLVG